MMHIHQHTPDPTYTAFQYYPFNSVVGFIRDPDQAEAAVIALHAAGFTGKTLGILHGQHGVRVLDRSGRGHGLIARAARVLQQISDQETMLLQRAEVELQNGSYLFRVQTDGSRDMMQRVRDLLKGYSGYFITFYHAIGTEIVDNTTANQGQRGDQS